MTNLGLPATSFLVLTSGETSGTFGTHDSLKAYIAAGERYRSMFYTFRADPSCHWDLTALGREAARIWAEETRHKIPLEADILQFRCWIDLQAGKRWQVPGPETMEEVSSVDPVAVAAVQESRGPGNWANPFAQLAAALA